MHIYLKKNPEKFYSNPIWNDGALGFFEESRSSLQQQQQDKMISDMGSVPDPKILSSSAARSYVRR